MLGADIFTIFGLDFMTYISPQRHGINLKKFNGQTNIFQDHRHIISTKSFIDTEIC